jgi:hypothetical protein
MQEGVKTKLSRSRVEAPQLLLDALEAWRQKTTYAEDDDFVFPSEKLNGEQPRSASQLVEDYIRPAAIAVGVITVENGLTYDRDGEIVKRFGFHNLGRHSLATFLMDAQENPALVQAIMRHAKMDMTLYYSHSRRKAKRAAQEKVFQHLIPEEMRVPVREQRRFSEREVVRELVYNDELTALQWALNSAVECHLHTSFLSNTFNNLTRFRRTAKSLKVRVGHQCLRVQLAGTKFV